MSIVKVLEGPGGGGRGGGAVVEVVGSVEDWDLYVSEKKKVMSTDE